MTAAPPPNPPDAARQAAPAALLLVSMLGGVYSISQFSRNSIGVVAPDMARELSLSGAEIGLLSSLFFLTFALAQLPLGVIIDRHGPKRIMLWCGGLVIVSVAVFSLASNFAGLLIGRALLGLGCSSFLMAPLVIYAKLYPPERYSSLTGLHLAFGNLGTIAATAPMAMATALLGWRGAFSLVGLVMAAGLVAITVFVASDRAFASGATPAERRADLWGVTRTPSFWPMMLLNAVTYPTFAAIAGLWGGPWLADVHGLGLDARGRVLFVLVASHIAGLFVWSAVDRHLASYKKPILAGGALTLLCLAVAALFALPLSLTVVWLALFGFGLAYAPLMMAHTRMLFPPEKLGRGLTLMNAGNMLGAFLIQSGTGLAVSAFPRGVDGVYPPMAYATVMAILFGLLIVAHCAYLTLPDSHPLRNRTL